MTARQVIALAEIVLLVAIVPVAVVLLRRRATGRHRAAATTPPAAAQVDPWNPAGVERRAAARAAGAHDCNEHAGHEHDGASEDWSPLDDARAGKPTAQLAHSEPDDEERDLLARLDNVVTDLRTDTEDLAAFRTTVDEAHQRAGLDNEQHRRWRQGALDAKTEHWTRDELAKAIAARAEERAQ
jgi:hypothetical protein